MQARRPLSLPSIERAILHSSSTDCSWITSLEVTNLDISAAELVAVSGLGNLRSFHMAANPTMRSFLMDDNPVLRSNSADIGINDRVLRSWAEAARERSALQHLRFIFLYSQLGVTKWSLPHLNAFPKLDEFCAYHCGIHGRDVKLQGWREKPE